MPASTAAPAALASRTPAAIAPPRAAPAAGLISPPKNYRPMEVCAFWRWEDELRACVHDCVGEAEVDEDDNEEPGPSTYLKKTWTVHISFTTADT